MRLRRRRSREEILRRALQWDQRYGIPTGTHRRPCQCGCARVDHVDPEGRWFDGMCTTPGCECTPAGYVASRDGGSE